MIKAGRIAQTDGVGRREQAETGMGAQHLVLVEQGELAVGFQHTLNHEHHIRAASVVFVKHKCAGVLQRPGQQAFAELGHLSAVTQDDGILADEVDAADVAVEVDANTRPVKAGSNLFDMGRLSGTVIALNHHPTIVREAGQNGACCIGIEPIAFVQRGHVNGGFRKCRGRCVGINSENIAHRHGRVGLGAVGHVGAGKRFSRFHNTFRIHQSLYFRPARYGPFDCVSVA